LRFRDVRAEPAEVKVTLSHANRATQLLVARGFQFYTITPGSLEDLCVVSSSTGGGSSLEQLSD
jgi:hypothetical protein